MKGESSTLPGALSQVPYSTFSTNPFREDGSASPAADEEISPAWQVVCLAGRRTVGTTVTTDAVFTLIATNYTRQQQPLASSCHQRVRELDVIHRALRGETT